MKEHSAYKSYKDSEIDWVGIIPKHWEIKKNKHLFIIVKRIAGELGKEVLSITQHGIKVKDIESGGGQLSMDYSKYQIVEKGDFGMNHMDLITGYVDISKFDGVMSPDYRVFKLIHLDSDPNYMLYLFQKAYWDKLFFSLGQGSSELGRWRLPADEFNLFKIPVPPLQEQTIIANFLDKKTTEINEFIALKEKTIGLLKERKMAIITQSITKGLNSSVEMKDSDIEWLGEIPKHWEVKKMKYLSKIKTGDRDTVHKEENGTYPFFVRSDKIQKISSFSFDGEAVLTAGDGAGVGKVFHYTNGKFDYHQRVYKVSNFKNVIGKFIYYYMKVNLFKEVMKISVSTTVESLRLPMLLNFPIAYPNIKSQKNIIEHIDFELKTIDDIIINTQNEINLIKEYQQSLISEVVTGKVDVRKFKS